MLAPERIAHPQIEITPGHGWSCHQVGARTVFVAGYLHTPFRQEARLADTLASVLDAPDLATMGRFLHGLDGHFACVVTDGSRTLASVDRVASIPLFWAHDAAGAVRIGARARTLLPLPDRRRIDPDAALAFAMGGFTTGHRTLFTDVASLMCGECALFEGAAPVRRLRWYSYRPWLAEPMAEAAALQALTAATLGLFEKVRDGLGGAPVIVPLSAGLDSRLIASALHHLGVRDVTCVSYGQRASHEALWAQRVAERLGYRWVFSESTLANMRTYFAGEDHRRYRAFADTLQSVPTEQDFAPLLRLQRAGALPAGGVIINGQSGDYITGGHVARSLMGGLAGAGRDPAPVWRALVAKHFALWPALNTPANDAHIAALLDADLRAAGAPVGETDALWALYEASEWQDRQVKHVIAGQRAYDLLGFDWRLPLWDSVFCDFWERVPLALKRGQALYRAMLRETNWGDVWRDLPAPGPRHVVPRWIRPLRLLGKAACAPFGRATWHRMERRFFEYRMGVLCLHAAVPYRRIALDRRDGANVMAWINEPYLASHGIAWDGTPRADAVA